MPHIHEAYDFTVGMLIVHNERVLFVNHPRYNKWLTPGGHVELNEDPEQALFRETAEETGLTVRLLAGKPNITPETGLKLLPRPDFMDVHEANPPHKHIGLMYVMVAQNDQVRLSNEHLDFAWLSREDLASSTYGLPTSLRYYAEQALDMYNNERKSSL